MPPPSTSPTALDPPTDQQPDDEADIYEECDENIYDDGSGLAEDAESYNDEKMIYETVAGEVKFTLQYVQPNTL